MELVPHSFEAGRRGKPDEHDANIAHLVGQVLLTHDADARFDLDVTGRYRDGKPLIRIGGEVSEHVRTAEVARAAAEAVRAYHAAFYDEEPMIEFEWTPQEATLSQNGEAGDSGHCIGVATTASPTREPLERYLALRIRNRIDELFLAGAVPGLKADGKVQVDTLYRGAKPVSIESVIVAAEHAEELALAELRETIATIINEETQPYGAPRHVVINGLGAWHTGGWRTDSGSRHAKAYRDGFATHGCNEDSLSGEDPSKPGPTGSYLARYLACRIIDEGLAEYARVHLRYTIGREDVGLHVVTLGTGKLPQQELEAFARSQTRGLRVKDAIRQFDLRNPALYARVVAASDHFHLDAPWNGHYRGNVRV
ncbi:hypothetical protein D6789_04590 [Candidatus Woesearchaeota archaeon]|nr:MAG: hypothetical protein D6789_04590 [Candidatus Woesearchaeota archaeon]